MRFDSTISQTYETLLALKPKIVNHSKKMYFSLLASATAKRIDDRRIAGIELGYPLSDTWEAILDKEDDIKSSRLRHPIFDFSFELYLFPFRSFTLAIPNCEHRELLDILEKADGVREYGYWDSADRPEEISSREWQGRRVNWDRALPGAGIPAERCLTFQFTALGKFYPPKPSVILKMMPSIEERLERAAKDHHCSEVIMRLSAEDQNPISHVFEAMRISSQEKERHAEIMETLRPMISEITENDLTGHQ